jgi:predicted alpha/beta-fold hydrolase
MIVTSRFRPAWWLPGAHLQTLYPNLMRTKSRPGTRRERLELPDGDFLDLDWIDAGDGALVMILHGLEGSVRSHYAGAILVALRQHGYRAVLMHFRGCSGEPNRLARSYHSGETGDLDRVVRILKSRFPDTPLAIIGYSLGGNVLLKWLGEQGRAAPVQTAVAVSVPFDLARSAEQLNHGFRKIYQRHLLRRLHRSVRRKAATMTLPVELDRLPDLDSFRDFDNEITAPLHGYGSAEEYYALASSRQYLGSIGVPTLILHATDDPFLPADGIPAEGELSPDVCLELSDTGGHVGFVSGALPWNPQYWLEERIITHLDRTLGSTRTTTSRNPVDGATLAE